ncbi:MAG: hypothetical protein JNJ71_10850 [Rubrivivax sp.]|nr:hypothetical protein [Rubrivivax sp.]
MTDETFLLSVAALARQSGAYDLAAEAGRRALQARQRRHQRATLRLDGSALIINGMRHEAAPLGAALAIAVLGRPGIPTCWGFHASTHNATRNALRRLAEWLVDRGHHDLGDSVRGIKVFGPRRPADDGEPDPLDGCALLER